MKNRKNNWIKIVIQLLSFILIPELFVTGFTAIGDIFSQIYAGSISWESVRYSVYVLIATVPGSVLVGRFFCGFFCSFGAVQDFLWFAARKLGKGSWRRNRNPEIYKKADRVLKLAKYGVLVYFVIFIWSGVLTWKKQGPWEIFGQYIVPGHWPGVKPLCSVGGILLLKRHVARADQSPSRMDEGDLNAVILVNRHDRKRPHRLAITSINQRLGSRCQALRDMALIQRMQVIVLSISDRHHHRRVPQRQSAPLFITQPWPIAIGFQSIVRQLGEYEW